MTATHQVVSHAKWIEARKQHLAREKEFTRLRDQLSAERRALPWVKVDKAYLFEGRNGKTTLAGLFGGRSQLIVYHFMLGPDWEEGCKSCSFWADNLQGIDMHLAARDVTLLTVSSAPLEQIETFKTRMGWTHEWVSSAGCDFNHDYQVTFTPDELEYEVYYNYTWIRSSLTERPGISVFCKDADGIVYHTYSCYSRGLDMLNGAYHYLDLVPKGRDEPGPSPHMTWVRLHDTAMECEMNYRDSAAALAAYRGQIAELRHKMREIQTAMEPERVADYTFTTPEGTTSLSDLFGDKNDLIVIHNMGKSCVNCTLWADGFNGVYEHLANRAAFVVASPDAPDVQRRFAADRDWRFPMVSHTETAFAADMGYRSETGGWLPGVSAFRRGSGHIERVADTRFRPGDDFCTVWHLLGMLPSGADGWSPRYSYE